MSVSRSAITFNYATREATLTRIAPSQPPQQLPIPEGNPYRAHRCGDDRESISVRSPDAIAVLV